MNIPRPICEFTTQYVVTTFKDGKPFKGLTTPDYNKALEHRDRMHRIYPDLFTHLRSNYKPLI